ncbi:MAG TPA: trypsin-like peptidase domain-containing protein [Acidimicrobiales bacterium]|nr:trypsin-like peptidase domain-containing protein [Acidimicrobiales bacterium]
MIRRRWSLAALALCALATACVPGPPEHIVGAADPPTRLEVAADQVLRIRSTSPCMSSTGSGFVVDGHLVTNRHVIEGAQTIQVETWDGRNVPVGEARIGVETDLGVIDLPPGGRRRVDELPFGDEPEPGASLIAVGYAQGGPAVTTRGVFLDEPRGRRFGEPDRVLRMNVSVRPGNSGGPLLDDEGNVVGVVFAYETATLHGLAVPRERIEQVLSDPGKTEPVVPCG